MLAKMVTEGGGGKWDGVKVVEDGRGGDGGRMD